MLPEPRTNWPLWSFARAASTVPRISNPHATLIPCLCSDNVSCCTRFAGRPDLNDYVVFRVSVQYSAGIRTGQMNPTNTWSDYLISSHFLPQHYSLRSIYTPVCLKCQITCMLSVPAEMHANWAANGNHQKMYYRSRFGFIMYKEAR